MDEGRRIDWREEQPEKQPAPKELRDVGRLMD
jgi:hypothetical protein